MSEGFEGLLDGLAERGDWRPLAATRTETVSLDRDGVERVTLRLTLGEAAAWTPDDMDAGDDDPPEVLALAAGEGPRADWWVGRFFPNDCQGLRERFPWPVSGRALAYRVRSVPGRRTLRLAEKALGSRALPRLEAWKALWATACEPDSLDALRKVSAFVEKDEAERKNRARGVDALSRGQLLDAAAVVADPQATRAEGPAVRDPGLHVMEDASVHLALAASGVDFTLDVPVPGKGTWRFGPDGRGGLRRLMPEEPAHRVGRTLVEDHAKVVPYWRSGAFRARCGRGMAVAPRADVLAVILLDMARQGHAKAFLKALAQKGGTWTVDLAGVDGPDEALSRAAAAMGRDVGALFGDAAHRGMLVQDHVPFHCEHRFLVVRHRVVASTASVRALSTLDCVPERILQPYVAVLARPAGAAGPYDRGEQARAEDRGLVARMARGARDLARALRDEGDCPDAYCIDMGTDADGRVLPIEVNSFALSGLYAMDYARVARALALRPSSRPEPRPLDKCVLPFPRENEPTAQPDRAAREYAAWALGQAEARTFGFREAHGEEIASYLADAYRLGPAEAAAAVAAFEPHLHREWRARYVDWLVAVGRARATEAAAGLADALDRSDGLVRAWFAPPDGFVPRDGSGWVVPARAFDLLPPGDAGDGAFLVEVEAPADAVQRWQTVGARIRSHGPMGTVLTLRPGTPLVVTGMVDAATGGRVPLGDVSIHGEVGYGGAWVR